MGRPFAEDAKTCRKIWKYLKLLSFSMSPKHTWYWGKKRRSQASQERSSWHYPGYLKARYLLDEVASRAPRDWFTKNPEEFWRFSSRTSSEMRSQHAKRRPSCGKIVSHLYHTKRPLLGPQKERGSPGAVGALAGQLGRCLTKKSMR